MVLVVCDLATGPERPLTYLVGALTPVLEGLLVVLVVSVVLMGALLPPSAAIGGVVSPASVAIVLFWLGGVVVINRVRKDPRWSGSMPGSRRGRRNRREARPEAAHPYADRSTARVVGYFAVACAVTLVAGVALELSGEALANRAGINGVIFGATVLASATALPEISSGLAAVKLGDNALAIGDIFGGNAFQVCLFLVADLVAGSPVLPTAGRLNGWLASLGVSLTAVYGMGLIVRPDRRVARLRLDSIFAIVVFAGGVGESGRAGGGAQERLKHAIDLYREGYATRLVLSSGFVYSFREAEVMRALAIDQGVPASEVVVEQRATNTYENVRYVADILREHHWRTALLVSSPYHMRRALLVWQKQAADIEMIPSPPAETQFYAHTRGATLEQVRGIVQEYVAIAAYWRRGWI